MESTIVSQNLIYQTLGLPTDDSPLKAADIHRRTFRNKEVLQTICSQETASSKILTNMEKIAAQEETQSDWLASHTG